MRRWLGVLVVGVTLSACTSGAGSAVAPSDPDPGFTGSSAAASVQATSSAQTTSSTQATSSALLRPTHGVLAGLARLYGGPARPDGKMALNGDPGSGIRVSVSRDSHVVATMVTGRDGRFSFVLTPGRYVVSGCSSFTVVVRAGARSSHDLTCPVP